MEVEADDVLEILLAAQVRFLEARFRARRGPARLGRKLTRYDRSINVHLSHLRAKLGELAGGGAEAAGRLRCWYSLQEPGFNRLDLDSFISGIDACFSREPGHLLEPGVVETDKLPIAIEDWTARASLRGR